MEVAPDVNAALAKLAGEQRRAGVALETGGAPPMIARCR
jgi:hypothetical protein